MDVHVISLALIDWPKPSKEFRTIDQDNVDALALSIEQDGLIHAITVTPSTKTVGRYDGAIGQHRFLAFKKLKRTHIEANVVIDMSPEEARIANRAENLFRNPLNKAQHANSMRQWYDHYEKLRAAHKTAVEADKEARKKPAGRPKKSEAKAENPVAQVQSGPSSVDFLDPVSVQPGEILAVSATIEDGELVAAEATVVIPPKPPKNFAAHAAKITGQSETTVKRSLAVGKAFDEDQLEVFVQCNVSQTWMETIAKFEPGKRSAIVNLIGSGMDPKDAIAQATGEPEVKRADGATFEVSPPTTDGKPEDKMSHEEWLSYYCSELIALLADPAKFKAHAILYREMREQRQVFRSKTKKLMAMAAEANLFGGFFRAVYTIVNIAHPKHWLRCGNCLGAGFVQSDNYANRCHECSGNGFHVKTEGA